MVIIQVLQCLQLMQLPLPETSPLLYLTDPNVEASSQIHCAISRFVHFFLTRIDMLRSHGVEPIIIFDGGRLPIKAQEEDSRRRLVYDQSERWCCGRALV